MHGEWVMLWVAAMYSVLAILSMTDEVCLACMQKLHVESMSSVVSVWYVRYMVCMVCWSLSYVVKSEHGRYGSMKTVE